jgi:4-hydroxy-3-methylbut-2-enyl diphosphate reductase
VRSAVSRALGAIDDYDVVGSRPPAKPVFLLGDLVNNKRVMNEMRKRGFIVAKDVAEIPNGAVVVIRAHGVGRAVYTALAAKNCEVVDAPCPKVRAIHKIAENASRLIIVGKAGHPEVVGIAGWCDDAQVVGNADELAAADFRGAVHIVAQTTADPNLWQIATGWVRENAPHAIIH